MKQVQPLVAQLIGKRKAFNMSVGTYKPTDNTSDTSAAYKSAIDNNFAVLETAAHFAVREAETPNMTVVAEAGILMIDGQPTVKIAQTSATITAPVTDPRIDRIVLSTLDATISIIAGTEAASPVAPDLLEDQLSLAQILLQTSTTAIDNSMITTERGLMSVPPVAAGGAWELISSATASASPSVEFTSGFDTGYTKFAIEIKNVLPATDSAELYLKYSSDAGSTYIATNYGYAGRKMSSGNEGGNDAINQTQAVIGFDVSNNASYGGATGWIEILGDIASASTYKSLYSHIKYTSALSLAYPVYNYAHIFNKASTVAIDAFKIYFSTGNITSGDFYLYGMKDS